MRTVNFSHLPPIFVKTRFSFRRSVPVHNQAMFIEAFQTRVGRGVTDHGLTIPPIVIVTAFQGKPDITLIIKPCDRHSHLNHQDDCFDCFRCIFHYVDLFSDFRHPPPLGKEYPLASSFLKYVWIKLLERSKGLRDCIDRQAFPQGQ